MLGFQTGETAQQHRVMLPVNRRPLRPVVTATKDCSGRVIVSLGGIAIAHQPNTNGKRDRSGALPEICSQGKLLIWGKRLPSQ